MGQTPLVFWGHLGRAGEGGCRNTAVRRWGARLRAARSAPFRQGMPTYYDTSSIKIRAWGRWERLIPVCSPRPCFTQRVGGSGSIRVLPAAQPHFNVDCTKPPRIPRGSWRSARIECSKCLTLRLGPRVSQYWEEMNLRVWNSLLLGDREELLVISP